MSVEAEPRIMVPEPGVWSLDEASYHADPVEGGSLSASGSKLLLSCPAKFRYYREHPRPPKDEFDFGHVAHKLVLNEGHQISIVEHDSWRTNAAKEEKAKARKLGRIPILRDDYNRAEAMAKTLREEYPRAAKLFDPAWGWPEQSLVWRDERTGIMRRRRLDWLTTSYGGGRYFLPDYKTCASAAPDKIERAVYDHGYHIDAVWSIEAVRALGIADDAIFLLVFQEKEPPYVVTVAELSLTYLEAGAHYARKAIDRYIEYTATDSWPGYVDDVAYLSMPGYAVHVYMEEIQ